MKKERGTAVVQARLDIRDLAVLIQYEPFSLAGTKANLLRMTVESFANLLVAQGRAKRIEDSSEALSMLDKVGMLFKDNRGKYNLKLTKALQAEAITKDGFDVSYLDNIVTKGDVSSTDKRLTDPEQIRKAVEIYRSGDLEVADLSKPPAPDGSEDDSENNENK